VLWSAASLSSSSVACRNVIITDPSLYNVIVFLALQYNSVIISQRLCSAMIRIKINYYIAIREYATDGRRLSSLFEKKKKRLTLKYIKIITHTTVTIVTSLLMFNKHNMYNRYISYIYTYYIYSMCIMLTRY